MIYYFKGAYLLHIFNAILMKQLVNNQSFSFIKIICTIINQFMNLFLFNIKQIIIFIVYNGLIEVIDYPEIIILGLRDKAIK